MTDALPVDPETDRTWRGSILVAVFVGGCAGGLARYGVLRAFPESGSHFPWTVLAINCSGAMALAVLLIWLTGAPRSSHLRPLLGTGFLGAWTTFSSIVASADQLMAHGHLALGVGYVAASAGGGLLSAALGWQLGRGLGGQR